MVGLLRACDVAGVPALAKQSWRPGDAVPARRRCSVTAASRRTQGRCNPCTAQQGGETLPEYSSLGGHVLKDKTVWWSTAAVALERYSAYVCSLVQL